MLEAIGVDSIGALFEMIPEEDRLARPLALPPSESEMELTARMARLGRKNVTTDESACFLGGGAYDHFIPALIDMVASRGEFYTAYTPYQAEASQGTLQAIFEYQTLVTQLTGMDVSNASLYDGGSALVEAVLMALGSARGKSNVVAAGSVHPEYLETVETYLAGFDATMTRLPTPEGTVSLEALEAAVDENTACVVLQQPNCFGCLEEVQQAVEIAHRAGALFLVAVNPISLGLLKRPGDYGADIVVAEGQPLGCPLSFGGPYLGILACREKLIRKMPGRLVGQTVDRRGNRCWTLTLQTREQHIRREKATSNICTNQGLYALRAAVYLATLGPVGLRETAELCVQKAHYAADEIIQASGGSLAFDRPFFNEFAVRLPEGRLDTILATAQEANLMPGIPLTRWFDDRPDTLLVAVTEKRTKEEIDRLVKLCGKS